MNEQLLKSFYYDPKKGYLSADKLYRKLHLDGWYIPRKEIEKFIEKQETVQITKKLRKRIKYNTIEAAYPGSNYQMDIMVYSRYEYGGYKYILNIVDVYSRYAQSRALKTKKLESIIKAFKEIMEEMGWPANLNADNEFNKKEFTDLLAAHDVTVWFSQPDEIRKQAIVERFNGTLANMIQKWRTGSKEFDWPAVLDQFDNNYNKTYHQGIKAKPIDVWKSRDINHKEPYKGKVNFDIGDRVRIKIHKNIFDKGDVHTYTKEIYTITSIIGYRIFLKNSADEILERYYKPDELMLVDAVETWPKNENKNEAESVHIETQKERKLQRNLKKEGIEEPLPAPERSKRIRVPTFRIDPTKNKNY